MFSQTQIDERDNGNEMEREFLIIVLIQKEYIKFIYFFNLIKI